MSYDDLGFIPQATRSPERGDLNRLARDTLALVMAGGRGSRLGALTDWRAKPAVPFAGKFRIIDFTLSNCVNSGIRRIGVLTQYRAHTLIRHLQQGWGYLRGEFGECLELLPAQQRMDDSSWYAGTADAVYQNLDVIRTHAPRHVLVLAGDHIYKMDYARMIESHVARGAQLTVGCIEVPRRDACGFGVMQVDAAGRVRRFTEKPVEPECIPGRPDMALASMGIYVFDTDYLVERLERDATAGGSQHDFGRDIIPAAIHADHVYAHPLRDVHDESLQGYWRDVGTVESYWASNLELAGVMPELNLYDQRWPIRTHEIQAPPAKFVFDGDGLRGFAIDSLVAGGCIVAGATVHRSVLYSNARVEVGAIVEDSVILPGAVIGARCRIRRAVIDERCRLPDGLVVGEDREQDGRRFHVTDSGLVLVTPAMLDAALV